MKVFQKIVEVLVATVLLTLVGAIFVYCIVTPDPAYDKGGAITKQQRALQQELRDRQEPQEILLPRSMPSHHRPLALPLRESQRQAGKLQHREVNDPLSER